MGQMPSLPENIGGGKKGKNVAWGGIKGGLSRGQRPEDAPTVYTDQHSQPEAESAFPEVAAHPMLPESQAPIADLSTAHLPPVHHLQTPQPQTPNAQIPSQPQAPVHSQPPPSFAQGNDEAPHCPQCSARLEGGSNFCGECGHRLGIRIPECVSCQAPLDPAARFCGECGTKVSDATINGVSPAPQPENSAGAPADPEKAMEDYLSGFGPDQKSKHWSNKLKKILD